MLPAAGTAQLIDGDPTSNVSVGVGYLLALNSSSSNYLLGGGAYSNQDPRHSSIVLGHELGHAVFGIKSESVNVSLVENALRAALGENARTDYGPRTLAQQAAIDNEKNPNQTINDTDRFHAQFASMLDCDP